MCKFFDLICIFQCISLFSANKVEKSFPIILKILILSVLIIRGLYYPDPLNLVPEFIYYMDLPSTWVFDTWICLVHDPLLHNAYVNMSFYITIKRITSYCLNSYLPEI